MRKQVVLIMVDTQRTDMLSCYDPDAFPTPNLDGLASSGTRFTNGYTCQPVCGPARSAIFTGLYPHSNGMWGNCMQLGKNIKTAGELLQENNIISGYIGKYHLDGGDYFGYGKCPKGYVEKYWYDMRNYLDELTTEERVKSRQNMNGIFMRDIKEEDTFAGRCTRRALEFLEEYKEEDFFLTVSFDEPHDPSQCPLKYKKCLTKARYLFHKTPNIKADLKNKPQHHQVWSQVFKNVTFRMMNMSMKGVLSCNVFADDEIGRILSKIKETCKDAMVIYTADHGDMFLSHGLIGKGCVMYNEITKVPFLISGGKFKTEVNSTPVSHIDILPTVMEYMGCKVPKMMQGSSLFAVEKDVKRDIFIEFARYEVDHDGFMGFQPIRCIFDGKYKLVINLLTSDELYDEEQDPYEMKNLIADNNYFTIRNALHDKLIKEMNRSRDPFRGYYWHCRPWRTDVKPSYNHTGYTRQLEEEDFVQLDYSTGLPMKSSSRKK